MQPHLVGFATSSHRARNKPNIQLEIRPVKDSCCGGDKASLCGIAGAGLCWHARAGVVRAGYKFRCILLDNEGHRLIAKYYNATRGTPFETNQQQKNFER